MKKSGSDAPADLSAEAVSSTTERARYAFEASFAQNRLWVVHQLLADQSVYNMPAAIALRGVVHVPALERAFERVMQRHDSLRTTFMEKDGELVQVVEEDVSFELPVIHLSDLAPELRWKRAAGLAELDAAAAFDLHSGPLIRISLIRLEEREHLLLVNLHHIISDGWSVEILIRELSAFYNAEVEGQKLQLPELPVQYADYAHFQKEWMKDEVLQHHLEYWKQQLSGELPILQLPAASPRSSPGSHEGRTCKFTLSQGVTQDIRAVCRQEEVTPFILLLAVYKVWLYRYSGQKDVLVGTPSAGRELEEVEGVIGFFVNTLVIRTAIEPTASFRTVLQQVKGTVLEAYPHQEVPFEKVVEAVLPARSATTSLFQAMFVYQHRDLQLELKGLDAERIEVERRTAKFDLLLELVDQEEQMSGALEYRSNLFSQDEVSRMMEHFQQLLQSAVQDPEQAVSRLELLSEEERRRQLEEWNPASGEGEPEEVLLRIEQQAAATPGQTAVRSGGGSLSYGELNGQANRLARRLIAQGVRSGDRIGVCLDRSRELVVSLLAVLKAGGVYVPLDPALPQERLAYMLEQAGVSVLLTKQALTEVAGKAAQAVGGIGSETPSQTPSEQGAASPIMLLSVDGLEEELQSEDSRNLGLPVEPEQLMYIIFTSGSTGRPKGASVYRSGFARLMQWYTQEFQMNAADHVLLITSPSFDLTQKNLFAPLMTGGELVLLPSGLYDPREVNELLERHRITLLNGTPSAFYPLLDEAAESGYAQLRSLRHVFLGGEPIAPDRLLPWSESGACQAEIVNTYGPTECTDVTVYTRLPDLRSLEPGAVPIGRPTLGTQLYILNEGLGLVPIGVPGELCIAGGQVGGGYLGDELKTAEKFVDHPYGEGHSSKLYRTGDLAKYRPDGTVVYLGRMDHQVKIRGYRIELGEIEAALRECSGVKEAVVVARDDEAGENRLIAYVVPGDANPADAQTGGIAETAAEWATEATTETAAAQPAAASADRPPAELQRTWRTALQQRLPEYMVPGAFILLDEMPLSPNGKVDRRGLPDPGVWKAPGADYVAPRTPLEQGMAEVWAEVLGVDRVGVHDHFFELGGHSLSAMSLLSRMKSKLGREWTLAELFDLPTIAGLTSQQTEEAAPSLAPIPAAAERAYYPLSPAQKRLYVLHELEPESTRYNMPLMLELSGTLDLDRFTHAWEQLVERHESLRTSFRMVNNEPFQHIEPTVELELKLLQGVTEMEAKRLISSWIQPFDIQRAPLFRVSAIELDHGQSRILFDMHHIISDGVSVSQLTHEFMRAYEQQPLTPLRLQYKDYTMWYLEQLDTPAMKVSEAFWLDHLRGYDYSQGGRSDTVSASLNSLTNNGLNNSNNNLLTTLTKASHTHTGEVRSINVSAEITAGLRELASRTCSTLFMVFLSACTAWLSACTSREEVVVGTVAANRNHPDTNNVIGMFANTLPLRSRVDRRLTALQYLEQVRCMTIEALKHAAYPFEEMVRKLPVKRGPGQNPLFDTLFVMQNTASEELHLDGQPLRQCRLEQGIAKFHLTVEAVEVKDGFTLYMEYNTAAFSAEAVEDMGEQLLQRLQLLAWQPQLTLQELDELCASGKGYPPAGPSLGTAPAFSAAKIDSDRSSSSPQSADPLESPAPRTSTEKEIAEIWQEVLRTAPIGIHDDFFDIGGHSILAAQVASRIRSAFEIQFPLRTLFEHPTVYGIATLLEKSRQIAPETIFSANAADAPVMARVTREGGVPLSFAQQRLWFLDRLSPGSAAYNIFGAVSMSGPLDKACLARALERLIARHEALRTTFHLEGEPIQRVSAASSFTLRIKDLQSGSMEQRQAEAERLAAQEMAQSFDLERGPLLSVLLLQLKELEYHLLITMHHIISDAWSIGIFVRELGQLYREARYHLPPGLSELKVQYADYAAWQNEAISQDEWTRQQSYWMRQLGGELPVLELPADYPRPERPGYRGGRVKQRVAPQVQQQLQELCRTGQATLFMALLAAFAVLLKRLSQQEDFVIGSPIAGRSQAETEPLIGCFLNTLALRLDVSGDPTFTQLLRRTRAVCLDAYSHQDIPFEKLVELVQPERHISRNPIFDVMINHVNTPGYEAELMEMQISPLELGEPQAKFALTLYIHERDDGLELEFVYQKDLYSAARMQELAAQYVHLLSQLSMNPEAVISSCSLVTPRSLSLLPNPAEPLEEPRFPAVTELLEAVIARQPASPAISHRQKQWTYGELGEAVEQLAARLLEEGLQRGEAVALTGRRSFGLVAAMLGVMKAGGVLLTIGPGTLPERGKGMLALAGARRWIDVGSEDREERWLREEAWTHLYLLQENGILAAAEGAPASVPPGAASPEVWPTLQPDDPAYIFFTSGTTGRPKGILGCHKGLSHFLTWQRETFGIGPGDRAAQLTGLAFDVVLRDILTPLISGAVLCLPDEERDVSAAAILPWMDKNRITILHTVPSLAQSWLGQGQSRPLTALRAVFFAGEPLPGFLIRDWRDAFGSSAEIINLYGPTETTLAKYFYRVPAQGSLPPVQPVGSPLPQTQLLVLGPDRRLCGIGEMGELVIRTPFRTLGYLSAEDQEQGRFASSPFTQEEQDLLYFSGDLGHYLPDGSLQIAGRRDDQVKIRGMRVELGEIQSVLAGYEGVQEVAIAACPAPDGGKRLAAYYVSAPEGVSLAELRSYARSRLPGYMVPGAFIPLEELPLTPNGKIDRARLPDPAEAFDRNASALSYSAPQDSLEQMLEGIWCRLLGVERVGRYDNFFDLGGHSLLLLQAKTQLSDALGRDIPVVELFQYPTLSSLAAHLKQGSEPAAATGEVHRHRADMRQQSLEQRRQARLKGGRHRNT
ncbi:amino acid adenylation domain-containing protein [Paenibacillus algicola]|uniref:Amino acid adenylation domain-containing protein n=1 Tax=Paenibacillus algicola TaxID=2565926 RepID=A0A4P8XN87_9BACL|nr:non-ribosomal peptide synthetase [Paenibacillus algicola]QCT04337.1 amino acid adenylation domain-containing protein [Paenibacillus algicola]